MTLLTDKPGDTPLVSHNGRRLRRIEIEGEEKEKKERIRGWKDENMDV